MSYDLVIAAPDGSTHGEIKAAPALPEPGDRVEVAVNQQIQHWEVLRRRFTTSGNVVVIAKPPTT